eukprot:TRINITY_DN67235_c0_g1_i1.p1 TRINITY_DN67235_c0_g1~~TRINITY_DN67235_c0_g1_i1.p1  ORF type:complete len:340 (+),score=15.32 TRINITY_DN67235_c0_g1_i1:52-1071(+)
MDAALDTVQTGISDIISHMEGITRTLHQHSAAFDQIRNSLLNNPPQQKLENSVSSSQVKLNVGGRLFITTTETLLKEKDTFFCSMLQSGQWNPDINTDEFFLDRSPDTFALILDYLRTGEDCTDSLETHARRMLQCEADFFQIRSLMGRNPTGLRWENEGCDNTIQIRDDGRTAEVVKEEVPFSKLTIKPPCRPVLKWKLTISGMKEVRQEEKDNISHTIVGASVEFGFGYPPWRKEMVVQCNLQNATHGYGSWYRRLLVDGRSMVIDDENETFAFHFVPFTHELNITALPEGETLRVQMPPPPPHQTMLHNTSSIPVIPLPWITSEFNGVSFSIEADG